ncbi:hypothetical protein [Agitococcus lubricus]|uniref:Uncharacterized protein n=1 Tax=Agitococcus lubricus TaxID=1077255 RepID=A0A2T5IZ30_9GAMM|nr:hypothetical protein [Agitococcus lubricus]PTQ89274.1 hypothetical protein C8N29_1072 [Agitococcus lubricus]
MSNHYARIECIFYSHAWAILNLEKLGINTLEDTIIIELSRQSTLSLVINNSSQRTGISALLNPKVTLDSLAEYFPQLTTRIILASSQPMDISSLCAATQLLHYKETDAKRIVLLVNMMDACHLAEAWQCAESYAIYWDLADPISPSLALLGEKLAEYGCLSSSSWKGLHFYESPHRENPTAESLLSSYKDVLTQYTSLSI